MKFTLNNQANVNTLFVGDPHDTQDGTNFAMGGGNLFFGDPQSFSPKVYEYVIKRHNVRSVLDVGAGLGQVSYYLHHTFNLPVVGIEGLPFNVQNACYPLSYHNLNDGPWRGTPCDLVTCVEVVEHIEEKYIGNLLDTLCSGRLLLMTFARKGTHGQFHVNEQDDQYWVDKVATRNFGLLMMDTQIVRKLGAQEAHCPTYFATSGLLFGRMPVKMPQVAAAEAAAAAATAKDANSKADNASKNKKQQNKK